MIEKQIELFDVGERLVKHVKGKPCTAAPVGSGPAGETCGTCAHKMRVAYRAGVYLKCGLMEHAWTHGAGSDITHKWAACREWKSLDVQAKTEKP